MQQRKNHLALRLLKVERETRLKRRVRSLKLFSREQNKTVIMYREKEIKVTEFTLKRVRMIIKR